MSRRTKGIMSAAVALALVGGTTLFMHEKESTPSTDDTQQVLATIDAVSFHAQTSGRTVIDVRTPDEYAAGHLPGAVNIDFYEGLDFKSELDKLARNAPYAIYCRSGNRSGQTLKLMRDLGFSDVIDLHGGIVAWQQSGNGLCREC